MCAYVNVSIDKPGIWPIRPSNICNDQDNWINAMAATPQLASCTSAMLTHLCQPTSYERPGPANL